jgi:thymidylate synthase
MKITHIEARDLEDAWRQAIRAALINGRTYEITHGSFEGHQRKEIEFVIGRIRHPGSRPIVPMMPIGLPQPTDMKYVEEYKRRYLMSSIKSPNEQYTYGEDLEPQFMAIAKMYTEGGYGTNQATMTIGSRESVKLADPPCLRIIDTRVQDGRLHFFVYFRSWDLWGGFPSNMAAIQLMKEDLAQLINVEDGELLFASKGLHLYDHHWDVCQNLVSMPSDHFTPNARNTGADWEVK